MSSTAAAAVGTTAPATSSPSSWKRKAVEIISKEPSFCHYEELLQKSPYDVATWMTYIEEIDSVFFSEDSNRNKDDWKLVRMLIGRRSVSIMPGSLKLWKDHWEFVMQQSKATGDDSQSLLYSPPPCSMVISCMERALWTLHKMPRVWLDYLHYMHQHSWDITELRMLVNRALEALPVTQHEKIWALVIPYYYSYEYEEEIDDDEEEQKIEGNGPATAPDQQQRRRRRVGLPNVWKQECLSLLSNRYTKEFVPLQERLPNMTVETQYRLLRRFAMIRPDFRRAFADMCMRVKYYSQAAYLYHDVLQDATTNNNSQKITSEDHVVELWKAFLQAAVMHGPADAADAEIEEEDGQANKMIKAAAATGSTAADKSSFSLTIPHIEELIQAAMKQHVELQGWLWTQWANLYIRRGDFDRARIILERGLESTSRVKDFSVLFDAYIQLEEGLIEAQLMDMDEDEDDKTDSKPPAQDEDDWDILLEAPSNEGDEDDLTLKTTKTASTTATTSTLAEWCLARAEHLTSQRPLLLNRVVLRQNPHHVQAWLDQADWYIQHEQPDMAVASLERSLQRVHAVHAVNGNPRQLVQRLIEILEQKEDVDKARDWCRKIGQEFMYRFKQVDDLAECIVYWVEMELRHEQWNAALDIARRAVAAGKTSKQQAWTRGLHKSLRLWDLLLDLEESLGTIATTKDAYVRAMDLQVVTPVHVLHYTSFLFQFHEFEQAFAAFERGLSLFPHRMTAAKLLWNSYVGAFLQRYPGGTKMERTRELWERCLQTGEDFAKTNQEKDDHVQDEWSEFFIRYAEWEEQYGFTQRALNVYRRLCEFYQQNNKKSSNSKQTPQISKSLRLAYQLWIAKTQVYRSVAVVRDIYQQALANESGLQNDDVWKLCLEYCTLEASLQEWDRGRALYQYAAQCADPRRAPEFWKEWNAFEMKHGNEETFREMLRIKRSVQAAFSTVHYNDSAGSMDDPTDAAASAAGRDTLSNEEAMRMIAAQEGVDLETLALNKSVTTNANTTTFVRESKKRTLEEEDEPRLAKSARHPPQAKATAPNDDDEIDIDDIDDDDENNDEQSHEGEEDNQEDNQDGNDKKRGSAVIKNVPAAVFGELAQEAANMANKSN